jgi:DNA polymerase-3 subunit delta'
MEHFASVPEQTEAKRLLETALAEGPAHAYLLHGPPGVGKRTAAVALAAALLGDERRVAARAHPDLYVLEPLGEMIRIDDVRALRHDLHMRPFEADRRVYLVLDADRMNEDAADALLKDLEEPPPYAVIVLVASELGPLPPTILSRCQLVPFRRLSERAVREWIAATAPDRSEDEVRALARAAGGRLDRARRLLDPAAAGRREALIAAARAVYRDDEFDAGDAAGALLGARSRRRAGGGS